MNSSVGNRRSMTRMASIVVPGWRSRRAAVTASPAKVPRIRWMPRRARLGRSAPASGVRRGIHRSLGTFAGLAVTAALLLLQPGTTMLAILVMLLLFPTELFMARHYGIALTFFTPAI